MLKAGVFGAGHLGKIHLKLLQQSQRFELVGFYDADQDLAHDIEKTLGYPYFERPEDLIEACDFIDIVTPTTHHFDGAMSVLNAGKHVFIEKPITETTQQAEKLIALAKEKDSKVRLGTSNDLTQPSRRLRIKSSRPCLSKPIDLPSSTPEALMSQ